MKLPTWLCACALAALFASQAGAAIGVCNMKFVRNSTSIAVQAYITCDDADTNAVLCQIWQRYWTAGTPAAYDSGMVMQRRPGTRVFSGRILWIEEGKTAQFFVRASGAGIVDCTADTASCTRVPVWPVDGTQHYVSQATGSDANDGLSAGTPKKTIQAAIHSFSATEPEGSVVNVLDGEYHEAVVLSGGTNGRHYSLIGQSRDSTILCGANPNVEAGTYDGTHPLRWANRGPDPLNGGPDSVYVAYYPAAGGPADSTQLFVLGFGEVLHRKTSIQALFSDSTGVAGTWGFVSEGERSGWWWQDDTLYVKRRNGQTPSVSGNHFGYINNPITITGRNWQVKNLTVRYAGAIRADNTKTEAAFGTQNDINGSNPLPSPCWSGSCIQIGGGTSGAGALILGCHLYMSNTAQIEDQIWGNSVRSDSITVARNLFEDGIGHWSFTAAKARLEEGICATHLAGMDMNVIQNTVLSENKGFTAPGTISPDSSAGYSSEYSGNTIQTTGDDAMEFASGTAWCVNTLVMNNLEKNVLTCWTEIPTRWGTVFYFYNTAFGRGRGVKMGSARGVKTGTSWIYCNTFAPDPVGSSAGFIGLQAVGGKSTHNYFRNNLFVGGSRSSPVLWGLGDADSTGWQTNEFNYDAYVVGSLNQSVAVWPPGARGTRYTLATLRSRLHWETNGQQVVAPVLANAAGYSAALRSDAANVRGKGVRIAGVNYAFGRALYKNLPDIGASDVASPAARTHWWLRSFGAKE